MIKLSSVFTVLAISACGTSHAPSNSLVSAIGSGKALAGKSYCRMVGQIGGGQVEICLKFQEKGMGMESDTSSGIPRNQEFSYSVSGSKVTVVVSESPLRVYVRNMELADDGSTLTYREDSYRYVWSLK